MVRVFLWRFAIFVAQKAQNSHFPHMSASDTYAKQFLLHMSASDTYPALSVGPDLVPSQLQNSSLGTCKKQVLQYPGTYILR